MFGVNLSNCKSIHEYKDYLRKKTTGMKIVRGFGWEVESLRQFFLKETNETPLQFIDSIFPDKPAVLFSFDFHSCWCNSLALKALLKEKIVGLFNDEEIPYGSNCVLHEQIANQLFDSKTFSFSDKEIREAILAQQELFLENGITEIYSLMFIGAKYEKTLEILRDLDKEGKLIINVNFAYTAYQNQTLNEIRCAIQASKQLQSNHLRFAAIKIYLDGVIDNHSAYLLEPYSDDLGRGKCLWSEFDMQKLTELSLEENIPLHIHAIGDAAVKFAVDILSLYKHPNSGRHIIAHIQLCNQNVMKNMAKNDIVACMQPFWFERGENMCEIDRLRLGGRVLHEYPARSLKNHGVKLLFSSDCPASETFNPIVGITMAAHDDGSSETLSLRDGYKCYYQGAYKNDPISIKIGDKADFIVLDGDITKQPFVKVVATYLGGEPVGSKHGGAR